MKTHIFWVISETFYLLTVSLDSAYSCMWEDWWNMSGVRPCSRMSARFSTVPVYWV